MTLSLIGLGLGSIEDITEKGLKLAKAADEVYLEHYTSSFGSTKEDIEKKIGKSISLAFREDLEQGSQLLIEKAKKRHIALLVVGYVFSATTHMSLYLEAKKQNITVNVVFNASILTAIGVVGLELYKYGKTTSIPFKRKAPCSTPYKVIQENKSLGLHTLCLLDLELDNPEKTNYMTINEAIELLLDEEKKQKLNAISGKTIAVGVARLGQDDFFIKSGTLDELRKTGFGKPLHALIIPGKLHFVEEEALENWK